MWIEAFWTCLQDIFQLFEIMCYQFFCKENTLFTTKTHFSKTNSLNVIGGNPSMMFPLLHNQDLTYILHRVAGPAKRFWKWGGAKVVKMFLPLKGLAACRRQWWSPCLQQLGVWGALIAPSRSRAEPWQGSRGRSPWKLLRLYHLRGLKMA